MQLLYINLFYFIYIHYVKVNITPSETTICALQIFCRAVRMRACVCARMRFIQCE